jgi:hypothetical protein
MHLYFVLILAALALPSFGVRASNLSLLSRKLLDELLGLDERGSSHDT